MSTAKSWRTTLALLEPRERNRGENFIKLARGHTADTLPADGRAKNI